MIIHNERLLNAISTLERLKPELNLRRVRSIHRPSRRRSAPEAGKPYPDAKPDQSPWAMHLDSILEGAVSFPPDSLILGVCEDSLPFAVELTNPAAGAMLVVGDQGVGKTRLLRSVLASACQLNSPEDVAFYIVASRPDEYADFCESPHCLELVNTDELDAWFRIYQLGEEMERRRQQPGNPVMILVIDDLPSLLESCDNHGFEQLYRLVKHGARSLVWTIAALPSGEVNFIDEHLLNAFRTRLLGSIGDPDLADYLGGPGYHAVQEPGSSSPFHIPTPEGWIRFWSCEINPERTAQ